MLKIHATGASPRTGMGGGGGGGGGGEGGGEGRVGAAGKVLLSSEGNGVIFITLSAGSPRDPQTAAGAPGTGTIYVHDIHV